MKTTADINWDEVDEKYQYIAQDVDGSVWVYKEAPIASKGGFLPSQTGIYGVTHEKLYPCGSEILHAPFLFKRPEIVKPPEASVVAAIVVPAGHKHAQQMLEYAQDALVSEEPWKKWESRHPNNNWTDLTASPVWQTQREYRRKIRTVTVEIPEELACNFVEACATGADWRIISEVQQLVFQGCQKL